MRCLTPFPAAFASNAVQPQLDLAAGTTSVSWSHEGTWRVRPAAPLASRYADGAAHACGGACAVRRQAHEVRKVELGLAIKRHLCARIMNLGLALLYCCACSACQVARLAPLSHTH